MVSPKFGIQIDGIHQVYPNRLRILLEKEAEMQFEKQLAKENLKWTILHTVKRHIFSARTQIAT